MKTIVVKNAVKFKSIEIELKDFTLSEKKNEYAKQYQYEKFSTRSYFFV